MAQGWWFDVCAAVTDAAERRRASRWLVGIEDGERAAARLAEEVRASDRILCLREASKAELERHRIGRGHLRQV
jgi:hypothetical protein